MTTGGRLIAFFPLAQAGLTLGAAGWLLASPGPAPALLVLFFLYGLAPLAHRLHSRAFPIREGMSRISEPKYHPWWGSHQLQLLYITFPSLERPLRLVPGLFSAWLRLWGAQVGRGVYWTPHFEIMDRGLFEVGDHVVFGHKTVVCAHVIKPREKRPGELVLYVGRVRVGAGAFIGAGSRLGPGSEVPPGSLVPFDTDVYVNQVFGETR